MKTPEYLLSAVRQYRHNNSDGFVYGFDHDETIRIIESLLERRTTANVRFRWLKAIFTQIAKATSYIRKRCVK